MKVSYVNYKNLDYGMRLDAEYYKPGFLAIEKKLKAINCIPLNDVSESIKSFGAYALCNQMVLVEQGIPFIRCKDIQEGFVDFSEVLFIDKPTHTLLSKSAVTPNVVMLGMSGTVGTSAIANPHWQYPINSNQDIAKIITNEKVNPYYLSIFFNTKYGKTQTKRLPVGSIQQHIFIWQLKKLLIFCPSQLFQKFIERLYHRAIVLLKDSQNDYSQAEQILLTDLNLLNWKPKHRLSFVKNYSDIQTASRIDAEYFQPKYEDIVKEIKEYKEGYGLLGELVSIKDKNIVPEDESVYKYIELANISINGNITGFTEALGHELPTRARRKVRTGDVIVSSIEGSLSSIALINGPLNNALCSTGFYVIDSEAMNSETLLVFLKSKAGQLQLKKGCSGTILTAIGNGELKKVIFPKISGKIQDIIKTKITEMYKAKAVSDELLNIAKRGVELAIEKDEPQAQKWINDELNRIGITISK